LAFLEMRACGVNPRDKNIPRTTSD